MKTIGAIISILGTLLSVGSILRVVRGKVDFSNSDEFTGWVGAMGIGVLLIALGLKMATKSRKNEQSADE